MVRHTLLVVAVLALALSGSAIAIADHENPPPHAHYVQQFSPAEEYEPGDPLGWRVAGGDRFGTAVAVSRFYHEDQRGVLTVGLANGATMVDAMTAGASLNMTDLGFPKGPLLLTLRDELPEETEQEIHRLSPCHVVVLGGRNAVSDEVFAQALAHSDPTQAKCR